MFVSDSFVGLTGVNKDKALAQVEKYTHKHTILWVLHNFTDLTLYSLCLQISCYLHHIEQKDESIRYT